MSLICLNSSANYEMTNEQVLTSLQSIFGVKLANAAEKAPAEHMELPQTADLMKLKNEETIVQQQSFESYNELMSDILTEVMMNMANGKIMKKAQL